MFELKRRFLVHTPEQPVPFYIESIGYNPMQENVIRHEGYPCCHWLQTASGEGEVTFNGQSVTLPKQHGLLLLPNVPHRYQAKTGAWATHYLTFAGLQVQSMMTALGIYSSSVYLWSSDSEFHNLLEALLVKVNNQHDVTGLDHSIDLYRFMALLKKHGESDKTPSLHNLAVRMNPLLLFLEHEYADPNLEISQMADILNLSTRHLSSLFHKTFGYTPYQYLISLRIQKAKELLLNHRSLSIQYISSQVGFRDPSHFITTFRKSQKLTPEKFRLIYGNSI
jgi:AraC family transcriptional regulator of arabinose operon